MQVNSFSSMAKSDESDWSHDRLQVLQLRGKSVSATSLRALKKPLISLMCSLAT